LGLKKIRLIPAKKINTEKLTRPNQTQPGSQLNKSIN